MTEAIKIVQGDSGPQIQATLTRSDTGDAENLTGATIKLHFRKKGATTVLFSLDGINVGDNYENGIVIFSFGSNDLDLSAGKYEGEIEVVASAGTRESIYETLEFVLREDFA